MSCCPFKLIYIQANLFLCLIKKISVNVLFLFLSSSRPYKFIFFCFWKKLKHKNKKKQHWVSSYPMHCCCPKRLIRLIYIEGNFFFYLVKRLLKSFFDLKVKLNIYIYIYIYIYNIGANTNKKLHRFQTVLRQVILSSMVIY